MTGASVTGTAVTGAAAERACVAVLVARSGQLPAGADEVISEAGGYALVVGDGARTAAESALSAIDIEWADTGVGLRAGALAAALAPHLAAAQLVVLPSSPDGRDLAPRLAAELNAGFLGAVSAASLHPVTGGGRPSVLVQASRLDDRLAVPVTMSGPVVVTLAAGLGVTVTAATSPIVRELDNFEVSEAGDVDIVAVLEADPATMDLSDAHFVVGGGAGLVKGLDDHHARQGYELLGEVAVALGASVGATRVATDAGWLEHQRQIGTTGVAINPKIYLAMGVSGASQHVGGLGAPEDVLSVNLDPSCPMTAMADLGIVTDARALLFELARRLGITVAPELAA